MTGTIYDFATGKVLGPGMGWPAQDLSHGAKMGQAADFHFHGESLAKVKNGRRLDRRWQRFGDIVASVAKQAAVSCALNGTITYEHASGIVGADWLKGA